jgi:hypothetical protein
MTGRFSPCCGSTTLRGKCYISRSKDNDGQDTDMCGRFTARYTWRQVHDLYDFTGAARNLQAHYNIAPTDPSRS